MIKVTATDYHPRIKYHSRVFDEQEGYRFTYAIRDGFTFIETGAYLHWRKGEIVDIAFDISCMSGCAFNCKFCASSTYNKGFLSKEEIVAQVDATLKHLSTSQGHFLGSCDKYTFSFEGMGEPSLPKVSDNIQEAIKILQKKFSGKNKKKIQFIISTIGARPSSIKKWADNELPLETLQISLHAVSDEKRRQIIGEDIPDIKEIFDALEYYNTKCPDTHIKINYLLLRENGNVNYTQNEIDTLIGYLKDSGSKFLLKVSHLNETAASKKYSISGVWGKEADQWFDYIRNNYANVYEFGTASNLGISCGQLASYAEHAEAIDKKGREYIDEIYEEVLERNAVLFLGAGVARTLWNATQLAEELYNELGMDEQFNEASVDLQGIADIYYSRNKLDKLYNKLSNTIRTKKFPSEFLELTKYPWRAIYTTNYDDFLEKAYDVAQKTGYSTFSYNKISKTSDFNKKSTPNDIPIIKLHGCIHDEFGKQVLSSTDYLEIFWESNKQTLLKRFETDIMQHSVIFSGYSLNDSHISQIIYDINKIKSAVKVKGYLISPQDEKGWKSDYEANLLSKFNIKLIKCSFEDFLNELSRKRKALKIFVSGSINTMIPGTNEKKKDVSSWVIRLCSILGTRFEQEGINVRTGATSTDKVGYLVSKNMTNKNAKTYVWYGAESTEYKNEIEEMIYKENYGSGPLDVVDRITRECNIVLFVGGSGLALEEVYSAISRNLLVIPIRLVDDSYASNIVHNYFYMNTETLEKFDSDKSPSAKKRGASISSKYLTKNRLEKLDMRECEPKEVAETVLAVIGHYRLEMR